MSRSWVASPSWVPIRSGRSAVSAARITASVDGVEALTRAAAVESDYPAYPGQVELDLYLIPELAGLERANVVIETPDEGRWWAFASVTNNNTQLITTVTP